MQLKGNLMHPGRAHAFSYMVRSSHLHVCAWHTPPPKDNRDGNDAGSSPPSSVLHASLLILDLFTLYTYVDLML